MLATAAVVLAIVLTGCQGEPAYQTFTTPEDAVRVLNETVKSGDLDRLIALFGPESRDLISSSDAATGRKNREVFIAAVAERWRLEDEDSDRKVLVVGNEDWPFPIPLVRESRGWRFDIPAGREEVLMRRIGRNELAVIRVCRAYVAAQREYAARGHDGRRAGSYARRVRSRPGTQDGLYWPAKRGEPRSPLGDLVAQAAADGHQTASARPGATPFHGYHFRILEAQGPAAPGGPASYVVGDEMSGGFALIAWPAQYNASGIMTFMVNRDGIVYEQDLGADTQKKAEAIARYDPDTSWRRTEMETATHP
jgi:hypothetical protein